MSKNELYQLRKRLVNSEKYRMIIFEGSNEEVINLDIMYRNHKYLKEGITSIYKPRYDKDAVVFLEKSYEKLMIMLTEKNISYDSIETLICPSFFMKEYNIINDVDDNLNISKELFNNNMLIDNRLVSISYLLSVKSDGNIVLNDDINKLIDNISKAKFLVDYDNYAREVALNGFPLEDYNYDMLIQSQINNKETNIKLDFEKNKTL